MTDRRPPAGWVWLDEQSADDFAGEFYREADKSHPLFYERMRAVARRQFFDDFLFKIHDGRYAAIHLTWAVETTSNFPGFQIFDSLDDWQREVGEDANWAEGD